MILTPFQWTANSNGGLDFSSIFTQSNKSVENARNQLQTDTEALKKYSQGYKVASDKVEFFNSTMKNSSKTAQDYAANMFKTNGSVEAFTTHQIAASETLNQTTIATKAATIAGRALTIVVNTAIVALISWGINKLISCLMNMKPVSEKAQDSLKKATDNVGTANKSLNEAQSKLDSINTQIDTLKSQPALTFVEEGQLTKLEQTKTILYKDYELAQLTAKTAKIAQTQAAMQAVNTQFSTDHNTGSYDINTGKKSDWKTSMFGSMGSLQNVLDKYQQLIKQNTSESLTQADTIKQNLANLAKQYQDNANKIDGSYSEEAHDAKISAQQQVDAILSVIDKQNWLNAQFNSVWNNKSYISVENDLKHLAKQGKLTAATFKNPEFQNFAKALDGVDVSAREAANQINALVKSTKIDKDSAQNAAYSNKQLAESFKGLSQSNVKNYHNLQTILDDFKEFGQFSSEDLNSIISIFPDMSAAVMEYNAGLMSSGTLISQIKNKMESLQKSYKREIQQNLLNSSQFYSDTISKNTNLVAKLASLYGIDAKDYSTYQQLKDAITSVVLNKTIGKSADTASSLAQRYYANVKTYSDFEKAKKQVTNIVLQDIKGLNASSLAQLATIYGIDVKNFGNIEKNKLPLAKAIAEKMAQIYGVVNADFASTMKNQLKTLQTERNNLSNSLFKSPTVGSSDWYHDKIFGKSNQSSNAGKIKQIQALDSQISSMSNLIQGMNGDTFDLNKQIDKIINSVNLNIPKSNSELQKAKTAAEKAAKKAAEAAKRRAEAAKKAAEERKRALQDEYQHELNNIEAYKELDKYKSDKYGVKGLGYYKDLSALYSKWKNSSALDYSTILSLQEKIHSAHKEYEQNILDTSKQELQGRIDTGKVEENSLNHLNNIYQIQRLLNSSGMSLVNTRSNQLEIEKQIYEVQKNYAQNIIDKSYKQLEHRQNLGKVSDNAVLQNLEQIRNLLLHGRTTQLVNTEENRWQVEEKIYEEKKKIIDQDVSDIDKQVQLGKLHENSLEYINELLAVKKKIERSDLNAIDMANELDSINEKIYSSNKSYIQQLESDLSDENILGSFGYRIKQIDDQINKINDEAEAESKELEVEKAKAAWEEAQSQKTVQIYEEGKGFVYVANDKDISDKKQTLAEAERNERLEKLNQQKQTLQNSLGDQKKQLERALHNFEGYDTTTLSLWNSVQTQVHNVLTTLNKNISNTATANKNNYDYDVNNLNNLVTKTHNDYSVSEINAKNYSADMIKTEQDTGVQMRNDLSTLATNCLQYGTDINKNLASGMDSNKSLPIESMSRIVSGFTGVIIPFLNSCNTYGQQIDAELDAGIKNSSQQSRVINDVKDLCNKIVKQFKESFDEHSPSRVMFSIGDYLIQGLINGMNSHDIQSFVKNQLGSMINTANETLGSGVERWRSTAALALKLTNHYSDHNLDLLMRQMNTESGGDPNSINLWDINAKEGHPSQGLMQVIPSTFKSYAMKGYDKNILDPLSNIIAAIRYTWSRYGNPDDVWGEGHGYASGTENTIGGLIHKNENGYELELAPTGQGDYEVAPSNSKIFNSDMTKKLWEYANNPEGTLQRHLSSLSSLNDKHLADNIVSHTNQQTVKNNYHIDKLEFPNVQSNLDDIANAILDLPTYAMQKNYSNSN